jgi:hypothetical protein
MLDFQKLFVEGGVVALLFLAYVYWVGSTRPRAFLNKEDVPADILAVVPPKTEAEKQQAKWLMIPLFVLLIGGGLYSTYTFYIQSGAGFFPVFLYALGFVLIISLSDLVIMDWLILNTWTPKWAVFPGTEGFTGYKDYAFHGRAHLKALPSQIIGAAVVAGVVMLAASLLG